MLLRIREPVIVGYDGYVWDGRHRVVVALFLGLNKVPVYRIGADSHHIASTCTRNPRIQCRRVPRARHFLLQREAVDVVDSFFDGRDEKVG